MIATDLPPALTLVPPLTRRQRIKIATVPWRFIVWIIFAVAVWDMSSLITVGNTRAYNTASFTVLRHLVPGGMRTYGFLLAAMLLSTVCAYGRSTAAPRDLFLRIGLALFAAWYVGWTVGILAAWTINWTAVGVGGLGKNMAIAALSVLASWFAPHEQPRG